VYLLARIKSSIEELRTPNEPHTVRVRKTFEIRKLWIKLNYFGIETLIFAKSISKMREKKTQTKIDSNLPTSRDCCWSVW